MVSGIFHDVVVKYFSDAAVEGRYLSRFVRFPLCICLKATLGQNAEQDQWPPLLKVLARITDRVGFSVRTLTSITTGGHPNGDNHQELSV